MEIYVPIAIANKTAIQFLKSGLFYLRVRALFINLLTLLARKFIFSCLGNQPSVFRTISEWQNEFLFVKKNKRAVSHPLFIEISFYKKRAAVAIIIIISRCFFFYSNSLKPSVFVIIALLASSSA